jgi:hypothetical protein
MSARFQISFLVLLITPFQFGKCDASSKRKLESSSLPSDYINEAISDMCERKNIITSNQ